MNSRKKQPEFIRWRLSKEEEHQMKIGRILFAILTLVIGVGYPLASCQRNSRSQTPSFNGYEPVDKAGNIRKPDDFRDHYQLLGTFVVLDPKGKRNALHLRLTGYS
jgi:hypothetical protein